MEIDDEKAKKSLHTRFFSHFISYVLHNSFNAI